MPQIRFAELEFCCQMQADAVLSEYKGSMLRGGMGHGLRRACCTLRKDDCNSCALLGACAFPRLFHPSGNGTRQLPPPYCIVPRDDGTTQFSKGDMLRFRLRLFSYAVEYAPYYVFAVSHMGQAGVGRGRDMGQGTFAIRDIFCGGRPVYDAEAQKLEDIAPSMLDIPDTWTADRTPLSASVDLLTPCRFKQQEQFSERLEFSELAMLMLRRAKSLCQLDGQPYSLQNFGEFMELAREVRVVRSSLRWKDWTRWSGRQREAMQLGGLTGMLMLEGPLTPFLPFLQLARVAQIGKQTAFGLGQVGLGRIGEAEGICGA